MAQLNFQKYLTIIDRLFQYSYEKAGGYQYRSEHTRRVFRYCQRLAPAIGKERRIDTKALLLAAIFHDAGKHMFIEKNGHLDGSHATDKKRGIKHEKLSADYLKQFLRTNRDIDPALVQKSYRIIMDSISKKPKTVEAKILQDADVLDEFGLINVWRMSTYGAFHNVSLEQTLSYWHTELKKQMLAKARRMWFPASKKTAVQRIKANDLFFSNLEKEREGADIKLLGTQ
jgi:HD superfamily phosphodiesterase